MPRKPSAGAPARARPTSSPRRAARSRAADPVIPQVAEGGAPASFDPTAMWAQFAGPMQRAGEQAWEGMRHDMAIEAEDLQHAGTPQQLAGVPANFAAEQLARWTQLSNQWTAGLLDVQAAWFKQMEALAMHWLTPLFARNGRIDLASAQDLVEPAVPEGPMQALWSAQKLWTESTKVWLNAMSHDLQGQARQG
jgi:hypothetical protein